MGAMRHLQRASGKKVSVRRSLRRAGCILVSQPQKAVRATADRVRRSAPAHLPAVRWRPTLSRNEHSISSACTFTLSTSQGCWKKPLFSSQNSMQSKNQCTDADRLRHTGRPGGRRGGTGGAPGTAVPAGHSVARLNKMTPCRVSCPRYPGSVAPSCRQCMHGGVRCSGCCGLACGACPATSPQLASCCHPRQAGHASVVRHPPPNTRPPPATPSAHPGRSGVQ